MQGKPYRSFALRQQEGCILGIVITTFFIYCLVPGLSYAQQKKFGHDLFSVSFPTEQDGWACGRWGTILHSADGGKTWIRQQSGTDYTLMSISFVDPKHGWAVGDRGTILSTKDGGKSWSKQRCPVLSFLAGVQFVTPKRGWIVTERTTILSSVDGGETWQVQFKDEDFILKRISFCDEQNGWAVGEFGYTYHTDNGGAIWKKQAGRFGFSKETGEMEGDNFIFDVVAINPRTAWVVGIDGYIARTMDGGASWRKETNMLPKTHLFGVASGSQGTIVIGGNALLVRSLDGGESFQSAKVDPPITYHWIYAISPKGRGGREGFVAVGKQGRIYLGDNKGASWQRVVY